MSLVTLAAFLQVFCARPYWVVEKITFRISSFLITSPGKEAGYRVEESVPWWKLPPNIFAVLSKHEYTRRMTSLQKMVSDWQSG